eukprot:g13220.t1
MGKKGSPIHEAQAMLGRAHLLTVEQLSYMIGALTTTKDAAQAREQNYTHYTLVADAPLARATVYYANLGNRDCATVLGSAGEISARIVFEKVKAEGAAKQMFIHIWNDKDKMAFSPLSVVENLPLGRLNCATLKAAVEELRETFRACQIVDLITSFKFISEEDKIKKEREDERIETNRKSAEFIRNMFGNGMSLGMAPTPMMALMQPGMALDPADVAKCQAMAQGRELRVSLNGKAPVGSSKAPVEKPFDAGRHGNYADLKAANKTTLIFTPMEGGGLDARHVPVNSNTANTTTTGGASSSRDRPAPAGVAAGDVIFSPDLPGFVGHFKQDTMEEDDDEVSLFGTRAAARANGGSPGAIHASKLSSKVASKPPTPAKAMKKAMKKVPDIFPDADVEVEEEEVVKPAKKNKGGSPNPKPMKKVELVKKSPAMKKGKK